MNLHNLAKFGVRRFSIFITIIFLQLFSQFAIAADIVSQNYATAEAPGISSCTAGYNLLSGDIQYSSTQIKGPLPYVLTYRAPVRGNVSSALTLESEEETTSGWSDNYESHAMTYTASSTTTTYGITATNGGGSGQNTYHLATDGTHTTGAPSTATIIFIKLPGESGDTAFMETVTSGVSTFQRLYSADPAGDINNAVAGVNQLPWATDLGEYSLYRTTNTLNVVKNGVSYAFGSAIYTVSQQTRGSNLYAYVTGKAPDGTLILDGNSSSTPPANSLSNSVIYAATSTTTTQILQRVSSVKYQDGHNLVFGYDGYVNLYSVTDNRNNSLTFAHNYQGNEPLSNQVYRQRLITQVSSSSGALGDHQVATFGYTPYTVTNPSSGAQTVFYSLTSSSSPVAGSYTYSNQLRLLGAIPAYIRNQSFYKTLVANNQTPADSTFLFPVLNQVINSSNQIEMQWDVTNATFTPTKDINGTYNYSPTNATAPVAKVTIEAYRPGASGIGNINDTTTTYDDIANTISMVTNPSEWGSAKPGNLNVSTTVTNDTDVTITVNSGNYSCLTVGGKPLYSAHFNTSRSQMLDSTDRNGNKSTYAYDGLNRITQVVEAANSAISRTTTYSYGSINGSPNLYKTPVTVQGPYQAVTNTLNTRGQILTQTISSSQAGSTPKTLTYTYNENSALSNFGLLASYSGPRSDVNDTTTYAYDNYGNLATKVTVLNDHSGSPVNRTQTFTGYNSAGQPSSISNPNGFTDQFSYDSGYRVTQTIHSNGTVSQTTSTAYDTLGRPISATDADGFTTTNSYDAVGHLSQTTFPNGNSELYSYHPNGTPLAKIQKNASGTIAGSQWSDIDGTGNVNYIRSGGDDKQWVLVWHDLNNNVIKTQTATGIIETWTYDALNRVVSHTDGNGKVDTKAYDSVDNESATTASNSAGSTRAFRNQSVLKQEVNADYGTTSYSYDIADNMTGFIRSARTCSNTVIDQMGRPNFINCTLSGASDPAYQEKDSYTYDPLKDTLTQVVSSLTNGVNTGYVYDAFGHMTQKAQHNRTPQAQGYPGTTLTNNYSYTAGGKLSQITYPSGNQIAYNYNSTSGQVDGVKLNGQLISRGIVFDAAGNFRALYWGASSSAKFTMVTNDGGEVTAVTNIDTTGAKNFDSAFTYDLDGRLTNQTDSVTGTSESYAYDNKSQLLTDTINGNVITYTYDTNGNRLFLRTPVVTVLGYTFQGLTYTNNRLTSWTKGGVTLNDSNNKPTPDATLTGEVINAFIGGTTIGTGTYDAIGRRRAEANPSSNIYMDYNHKNERTLRQGQGVGQDRQYAYDESSHLIGEYDLNGNMVVEYVWLGERPIAAVYPTGRVVYIVSDQQNKPRRGIDASTQQVVWSWDPDAFGAIKPKGGLANPATINLRFPGQYYDSTTGLYYNHNRFYNPELGRYMEPDPTGLDSGLNPYAYAGNNPVNNVDPTGLTVTINGQYVQGVFDISLPQTYGNLIPIHTAAPASFAHPSGYTDYGTSSGGDTGGINGALSDAQLGGVSAGALNIQQCAAICNLIATDDRASSPLGVMFSSQYHALSFKDDMLALDAPYPSVVGDVSADWMLRTASYGFGIIPYYPEMSFMYAKWGWNAINLVPLSTGLSTPKNINAPQAVNMWMQGIPLRSIYAPSVQQCGCK